MKYYKLVQGITGGYLEECDKTDPNVCEAIA